MSDLLDQAVAKVRRLPPDRQEEAAEILLSIAAHDPSDYQLTSEQRAEVRRRLAEPPDYATEAEVAEVFDRLTR
jgi:transcription-repair coupling factor (superfamily II helicase)